MVTTEAAEGWRTVVIVRCRTCDERLGVVSGVVLAEHMRYDHMDVNPGHEATWFTTSKAEAERTAR